MKRIKATISKTLKSSIIFILPDTKIQSHLFSHIKIQCYPFLLWQPFQRLCTHVEHYFQHLVHVLLCTHAGLAMDHACNHIIDHGYHVLHFILIKTVSG